MRTVWALLVSGAGLLVLLCDTALSGIANGAQEEVSRNMRPAIIVTPMSLDFGFVGRDETRTNSFTIQNMGGGWLAGRLVVTGAFQVVSGGTYRLGPGESQPVRILYRPSGAPCDTQVARFTGGGGLGVFLNGNLKPGGPPASGKAAAPPRPIPSLSLSPVMLDFGPVPGGEARTNYIMVTNEGDGRLTGEATLLDPGTGAKLRPGSGAFRVAGSAAYSLESGETRKITIICRPVGSARESAVLQFSGGGGASVPVSVVPLRTAGH